MSNEDVRAALEEDHPIDVSTTGRATDRVHRFEIWFHYLEAQIYLTGRSAPRDWYANMLAHPHITTILLRLSPTKLDTSVRHLARAGGSSPTP